MRFEVAVVFFLEAAAVFPLVPDVLRAEVLFVVFVPAVLDAGFFFVVVVFSFPPFSSFLLSLPVWKVHQPE